MTISNGGSLDVFFTTIGKLDDVDVEATNHVWSSGASNAAGCATLSGIGMDVADVVMVVMLVVLVVVLLPRRPPSCLSRRANTASFIDPPVTLYKPEIFT